MRTHCSVVCFPPATRYVYVSTVLYMYMDMYMHMYMHMCMYLLSLLALC